MARVSAEHDSSEGAFAGRLHTLLMWAASAGMMLASDGVLSALPMMMERAAGALAAEDERTHCGCGIALACRDIGGGAWRREPHL